MSLGFVFASWTSQFERALGWDSGLLNSTLLQGDIFSDLSERTSCRNELTYDGVIPFMPRRPGVSLAKQSQKSNDSPLQRQWKPSRRNLAKFLVILSFLWVLHSSQKSRHPSEIQIGPVMRGREMTAVPAGRALFSILTYRART